MLLVGVQTDIATMEIIAVVSLKWELIYLKTQLYHSWTYTQKILYTTTETLVQPYSKLLYSEYTEIRNSLDVP